MSRALQLAAIILLLISLLAGCAPATGPAGQPIAGAPTTAEGVPSAAPARAESTADSPAEGSGGILVRAMTSEPASIDPQGAPSSGLSLVLPYLFDTLVTRDLDNSTQPLLAESWEVAPDGKSVTMKLKQGVSFHDGEPLNAEAVKFTFDRFLESGQKSPIYDGVKQIGGVEVVDDLTVRFTFDQPLANFFSTLAMPYAGVISPASARQVEAAGEGYLSGTGPFRLEEWKAGQSLTLAPNPAYTWGPPMVTNRLAPKLDRMIFKVIPDAATQLAALEAGEVDVIFINQPDHRAKLEKNPGIRLEETVLNSLVYLGFNNKKSPFDDPQVRRAVSHAVNKEEILQLALGGLGKTAFAPLPPTLPGFAPSLKQYELGYDPVKSEELLAAAGFAKGTDGLQARDGQTLKLQLVTSTRAPNDAIAALIQSQLAAVGIPVEIQQLDSKAVMEAANAGDFDLLLWRYEWNDPDALHVFLGTERIGSTNRVAYSNPDVDALLAKGARELDPQERDKIYVEAQKLIMADAPWQALYNPVDLMAISERVDGLKMGYMGRMLVNDAIVKER